METTKLETKNSFGLNKKLFKIHSWTGLFIGIFYTIIAISGASIVFMEELDELIYGNDKRIEIPVNGKKLSYDQLFKIAQKEYPDANGYYLYPNEKHADYAITMVAGQPTENGWFGNGLANIDYMNPYTGEIVYRTNTNGYHNILGFLDSMHTSLRLGSGGVVIVAVACVAILLSLITGFIIYRKFIWKALTFRIKIKFKNWRTASSDLHRVIGTWALLVNLFIFGTGMYMFYPVFTPTWWADTSKMANEKPAPVIKPQITVSIDSLFADSKKRIPEMNPLYFGVSCDTSRSISISGNTTDKLFLNMDNSASITYKWDGTFKEKSYTKWRELTSMEKFDNFFFTGLHTGWAYGTTGKIIWTIGGFTPAFLSITGFMLWWRRGRKSQKNIVVKN